MSFKTTLANFLRGVGSTINLAGSTALTELNLADTEDFGFESDRLVLYSDWKRVGSYVWDGIRRFEEDSGYKTN